MRIRMYPIHRLHFFIAAQIAEVAQPISIALTKQLGQSDMGNLGSNEYIAYNYHIIQICSGITRGRMFNGEIYAQ